MYGPELAAVYELVYRSRGKDWDAEAAYLEREIRSRFPSADSLLDVACGTGAHLESFRRRFSLTEGVELSDAMRAEAVRRLPDVPVHVGDMRSFDLGRRFDAVICVFCSIGYLETVADLRAALRSMAAHLVPGGVLIVEPWWFPEHFIDGYVAGDLARDEERTVSRISHSTLQGRRTRMELRFVIGTKAGISEFTEINLLTLFTREEYLDAFADAGCPAEYLEGGLTGRGLFIGISREAGEDVRRVPPRRP
ncbi:class I SAM-dependent methyltransferase [Thermobifida alba]|uniref:Class I SAM-dependent methyltransferase n=1 Tax=Thermobifida alba TaxID=53522 RepID=A0ABY4L019_THEAE|nr:class I SAM-dependent methyltransferase [Thermobifida alba]UPT20819.1 class I SAM-dependent methyltransferase [Thermobifida alba]